MSAETGPTGCLKVFKTLVFCTGLQPLSLDIGAEECVKPSVEE